MLHPLAELNPCPAGAQSAPVVTKDGVQLRTACWLPQTAPRGTLLLMQGRAEMIEKYFETIGEFLQSGFAVIAFDWRGQGGSQRLLPDPMKGHISGFDDYQNDLDAVLLHYHALLQKPLLVLAHSMGAAILMRALERRRLPARAVILTAPMFAIALLRKQSWLKGVIASLSLLGLQNRYPPLYRSQSPFTMSFANNPLTRDQKRFERTQLSLKACPALALGMPTLGWLRAAVKAMDAIADNRSRYKGMDLPPMLVFAPTEDRVTATPATCSLCDDLKTARLITLNDCEHEVLMESDAIRAQFYQTVEQEIMPLFPA